MTFADDNAEAHRAHRARIRAVLDVQFADLRTMEHVQLDDDSETLDSIVRAIELRHRVVARLEVIDQALLALSRSRLDEERGLPPAE